MSLMWEQIKKDYEIIVNDDYDRKQYNMTYEYDYREEYYLIRLLAIHFMEHRNNIITKFDEPILYRDLFSKINSFNMVGVDISIFKELELALISPSKIQTVFAKLFVFIEKHSFAIMILQFSLSIGLTFLNPICAIIISALHTLTVFKKEFAKIVLNFLDKRC